MKKIILLLAAFVLLCLGGIAHAALISYTVDGWGPTQYPGPLTPPANAPWGPNGYPGDTVGLTGYTGSLDLTPGTYIQKINTLTWIIDYTYGGSPEPWPDMNFAIAATRNISFGGPSFSLSQAGNLLVNYFNDYLTFFDGPTTTAYVAGYKIDITPLGLPEVGGSNFGGSNPWSQPSRDVMARFEITAVPSPSGGEHPYIAVIGNDILARLAPFYFSPKHSQFLYDQTVFGVDECSGTFPPVTQFTRAGLAGCEQFRSQTPATQREVCQVVGNLRGNAKTPAGNSGFYEWFVRLPQKPSGEINIVIQCGVLKPGGSSIELCAAETGERIGYGTCVRQEVDPGVSPVINTALPKIKAIAYPGPYNDFVPFNLTAFKNPSSYTLAFDAVTAAMSNNTNSQVLDGSTNARILLKACMDKAVITKLPVTGQINALGQTETDLEGGDMIYVRMDVPRQNTVDIYCHQYSAKLVGVAEGF
jgi:hypothetical protein